MFLWVQREDGKVLGGETFCLSKDKTHQAQEAPELNISRGWENIRGQRGYVRLCCSCPFMVHCPLMATAGYRKMCQKDLWLEWAMTTLSPNRWLSGARLSLWMVVHRQKLPLAEVLPLQRRSYCISVLNALVFKIVGFGATLQRSHVDPEQHEVVCWWLIWIDCLIGGSNLWI